MNRLKSRLQTSYGRLKRRQIGCCLRCVRGVAGKHRHLRQAFYRLVVGSKKSAVRSDEPPVPLLFTPDDLAAAKERASRQPEDVAAKQAAYRAERRIMRMTWAALAVALGLASALIGGLLL